MPPVYAIVLVSYCSRRKDLDYACHTLVISSVRPGIGDIASQNVPQSQTVGKADTLPISFVLNWYTPTSTPTVAVLSVQVAIGPKMGNLRLCR